MIQEDTKSLRHRRWAFPGPPGAGSWGRLPWVGKFGLDTSDSLGLQRTESPGSSTLECPRKSGSGPTNFRLTDCQAPGPLRWQPHFRVYPAPGIPL